jgi:ABC-2 type transport system permease protein
MIRKTIIKELKEIFRDGRFKFSALLVIILITVAVVIGSNQYNNTNKQYEISQNSERDVWDNQGEKNPHSAAHFGTYVFKPKNALALLDQGVNKYEGISIFLEAHSRNEAQYSAAGDQTELSRFGELTPEFILLFVIPLLIIIIGYNSFTKEKEGGTFILLKSQGISNLKLTIAKLIAVYVPVFIICSVLFFTAGIILSSLTNYGAFSWGKLLSLYTTYLLYYLVFTQIVLLISALVKRSGIALVSALSFWILSCFIAPKIAANIAEIKYPYPTKQEFTNSLEAAKKGGLSGHNPWSKEAEKLKAELLKEHNVNHVSELPFNFSGYIMQKGEEHEAEVYFNAYGKLKEQFSNQANTYKAMAFISPFLPARFLSMGIAGTDYKSHMDFAEAAETYRIQTQKFLNDNNMNNSKYDERGYKADASFWKTLPKFNYTSPTLGKILKSQNTNIIVLILWVLISGLLLFISTKKI